VRLRRADPARPGYRRRRHGGGFTYLDPAGEAITDPAERRRIRELVIPPAWRDVWISPDPRGHIQATGIDAAGRKQYLYHPQWRVMRDEAKFDHVLDVARHLPRLRARADKGGVEQASEVADPQVCAVLRDLRRRRRRADRIFGYWAGRRWHDVRADDVNDYLREASGTTMTAKDFRTWHATVLAAVTLATAGTQRSATRRKRAVAAVMREVADLLGNTPTVARTSYVDPRIVDLYHDGTVADVDPDRSRAAVEAAVVDLLAD
jgi:DNA topoisomerase IB